MKIYFAWNFSVERNNIINQKLLGAIQRSLKLLSRKIRNIFKLYLNIIWKIVTAWPLRDRSKNWVNLKSVTNDQKKKKTNEFGRIKMKCDEMK